MASGGITKIWHGYCRWLQRRTTGIAWGLLILSCVGAYYSQLLYRELRTDIEELLPASAPSVIDLKNGSSRFSGINHLEVVIESSDASAAKRFQIDVTHRLRQLPPDVAMEVRDSVKEERRFFDKKRALYVPLSDLELVQKYVKEKIREGKRKMFDLGLGGGDDELKHLQPKVDALLEKYKKEDSQLSRFPDGYFASPDGRTRVVLAFLPEKATDVDANNRLSEAATQIINDLNPAKYAPDLKVGLGGDVQNVVEEHRELVKDLVKSFVVVTLLVTLFIYIYFGSLSGVAVLSLTLAVGTTLTFGLSYFLVGYLNANTAFLGSIVIGNGINFPIILLARYAEMRRTSLDFEKTLKDAMECTWKPTLAAAMAAGISYGSLAFTDFRGFSQFGLIGAIGMTLCWLATYSVLPVFILLFERRQLMRIEKKPQGTGFLSRIAPYITRNHRTLAVSTAILSIFAVWGASFLSRHTIESDLSKLRNKWSTEYGSGYWGRKTDEIFGRGLTPTVILTENAKQSERLLNELKAIHEREKENSPFASFSSINDYVPADQGRKQEILADIGKMLTPKVKKSLKPEERKLVNEYLSGPVPTRFRLKDLPAGIKTPFQEKNGNLQTVVHAYPRQNFSGDGEANAQGTWNGEEVIRYTKLLREAIAKAHVPAVILGQNPVSADMLESIEIDGPKATLLAFLAVAILLFLIFPRWKQAAPVLLSLLLGVLWMFGAIGWFRWKINFLNFIALPITFGIGIDYAVNIFGRLYRDAEGGGRVDLVRVLGETGSAVVLCSMTTSIGYGSLLISGSQAFVSFGKLAVTGEITCILAAIISLPSLWLFFREQRSARRHEPAQDIQAHGQ